MQINIYKVRVRFVRDAKGELEVKPGRVILTVARNHDEARRSAMSYFGDLTLAGIEIEYEYPSQLSDTFAVEGLVYA